jgi:hypothetical protein
VAADDFKPGEFVAYKGPTEPEGTPCKVLQVHSEGKWIAATKTISYSVPVTLQSPKQTALPLNFPLELLIVPSHRNAQRAN